MVSRLDPELIIESEKTAARVRQELKSQQKPQGERSSRRQLGLEAPAVPDDPEMYLRHSHRSTLTHGANANGVTAEDQDEEEEEEEEAEAGLSNRRDAFPDRPRVLKRENLDLDLDDDMSGSSLSMSSSTTSLLAFGSEPVEPTTVDNDTNDFVAKTSSAAVITDERQAHADLSAAVAAVAAAANDMNAGEQETQGMDVDTPQPLRNNNDDNNEDNINGTALTSKSTTHLVDPETAASLSSVEKRLMTEGLDLKMTSGEPVINGSSFTPGSPSTATSAATTADPAPVRVLQPAEEVMDTIIPDQHPTTSSAAPEDQDLEPIKESIPSPPQVLLLDTSEVARLCQALVDNTNSSTVEELDQLRAALYEDLWEHRFQWDKGPMIQVKIIIIWYYEYFNRLILEITSLTRFPRPPFDLS